MKTQTIWTLIFLPPLLSGCYILDRTMDIGSEPPLTRTQDPTETPGYKPVTMPMPRPLDPPVPARSSNSLWQQGAKGFFKDQRAKRVGDILTVLINLDEKAETNNKTERDRKSNLDTALSKFFGAEDKLFSDPTAIARGKSSTDTKGNGKITRTEKINTRIAVTVTQVLPNGNLVLMGRQELRVNFEVREIVITGVVRASDINSDNTIPIEKIAEARVSYGGRGQMMDVQQPGWGQQAWDTLTFF